MKEKIFNAFRIVVLAFILSSAIGYSLADWTPPSGTPPFNNVPPPINVGPTTQVKDGNLFINNLLWAKKARSVSTVAGDTGDTLVTKDYVDGNPGQFIRLCEENDKCSGTLLLCGANAPDNNITVSATKYDISYGSWSNPECGTSGTGWHASAISSCSTGRGSKIAKCEWVMVK